MKIELALVDSDSRRWRGLIKVDGEVYGVTLFPGSATEEWRAVVEMGAFVELSEGAPLHKAIEKAVKEFNEPRDEDNKELLTLLKEISKDPNLLEELRRRGRSNHGEQGH